MAKWTDYTTDTEPTDNDEVMTLDADKSPKANKRVTLSTLADYFLDKLASKVFAKLETQNQTVIGALNELNSKALTPKQVTCKDTIILGNDGYYPLHEDFEELINAKAIEIAYYRFLEPKAAISVYVGNGGAYVFGAPNTVINGLRIRYWS